MAGSSLLTLLDDIATLLDDISVMGKLAAKKTAGVLGDDLSLNAQQVTGVRANRELPVVWSVAKGSLINKVILVPLALLISAFIPWAITPLLMLGGAFLCFEGVEKVLHTFEARKHKEDPAERQKRLEALADTLSPRTLFPFGANPIRLITQAAARMSAIMPINAPLTCMSGDPAGAVG